MYNIKQAAARAGVSVPVLRAWERRYGIVTPERTPSGYRRFDDASVARVRTMRGLVAEGWSPSAAAAAILAGTIQVETPTPRSTGDVTGRHLETASGLGRVSRVGPGAPATAEPPSGAGVELARRLVESARAMDAVGVDEVLDDLFAHGSFERVVVDLLFPALERLGEAWAAGEVTVAGEHLASNAILRRLGLALEAAASRVGTGERVLIGLPPGGRHELGALAFAVAARRAGLSVAYLGPDLPVADWVAAGAGARAAVIGVVSGRDRRPAIQVARALLAAHPALVVAFGGRRAPEEPGVVRLSDSLPASVADLRRAVDRQG